MILYFSATGNCKYVAKRLAEQTQDTAVSILTAGDEIHLGAGERLGVVSPTYCWRLPSIMEDYLKRVKITGAEHSYIFFVATYGTTSGRTAPLAKKILAGKGIPINACYSIRMVDNWTPKFDLTVPGRVEKYLAGEKPQIETVIRQIQDGECGDFTEENKKHRPLAISKPVYAVVRRTAHFRVEDSCIGCGICARQCPVQAIAIENGKPVWLKKQCVMCLGCLHHCPKFAIQYGEKTKKHGQYLHPTAKGWNESSCE